MSCPGEMLTDKVSDESHCLASSHAWSRIDLEQGADQPRLLRHRNEDVGADDAAGRMLPPRQRLEAVELAGAKIELRLVERQELAERYAPAQACLDLVARLEHALHRPVEPERAVAAELLGGIHRDVGAAEQAFDVAAGFVGAGHADRRADVDGDGVELERLGEQLDEPLGRVGDGLLIVLVEAEGNAEFVGAEAGAQALERRHLQHLVGGGAQQGVAGDMAVNLVDVLEPVEIEQDQGGALARRLGVGDHREGALADRGADEELGELVARREPPCLLLSRGPASDLAAYVAIAPPGEQDERDVENDRRPGDHIGRHAFVERSWRTAVAACGCRWRRTG